MLLCDTERLLSSNNVVHLSSLYIFCSTIFSFFRPWLKCSLAFFGQLLIKAQLWGCSRATSDLMMCLQSLVFFCDLLACGRWRSVPSAHIKPIGSAATAAAVSVNIKPFSLTQLIVSEYVGVIISSAWLSPTTASRRRCCWLFSFRGPRAATPHWSPVKVLLLQRDGFRDSSKFNLPPQQCCDKARRVH